MTASTIILIALVISSLLYIAMGFLIGKNNQSLADLLPIATKKTNSQVRSAQEFSSSTVATTVSLATIVLAYFELAGYFGFYLLWTVITTAIGMYLVSRLSNKIWVKLNLYRHKPSLHEFLGTEFNSKTILIVASVCTTIGFLMIFATEIIVGSQFLAKMVPQIPEWITVVFLSSIGVIYTLMGGFRVVIKTDQLQMKFIFGLIIVFLGYYFSYFMTHDFQQIINKIPDQILNLDNRPGLIFFLIGVAIMNIPTHLSNMSIWQRISASNSPEIVNQGFKKSLWGISFSWGLLVVIACLAYGVVSPTSNTTLLTDLLASISNTSIGKIALFFVTLGLYGAMLSTASTNLIVITHTISEDIIPTLEKSSLQERINNKSELMKSKIILLMAAIAALVMVGFLELIGFSIADLVFAIYGGSLALFPLIMYALYNDRVHSNKISSYATYAVILGFVFGWGAAITGKVIGNSNLIFLSPAFSIITSSFILFIGIKVSSRR